MNCTKCKQILDNDSVFCHVCGSKTENTSSEVQSISKLTDKNQIKSDLSEILALCKEMAVAPVSTVIRSIGNTKFKLIVMLFCAFLMIQSLMSVLGIKMLFSSGLIGGLMSLGSYAMMEMAYSFDFPYFRIFIQSLLFSGIITIGFTASMLVVTRYVMKKTILFKQLFHILVISNVPACVCFIISVLLSYFTLALVAIIIIISGNIISVICMYSGIREVSKLTKDKALYTIVLSYIITTMVMILGIRTII